MKDATTIFVCILSVSSHNDDLLWSEAPQTVRFILNANTAPIPDIGVWKHTCDVDAFKKLISELTKRKLYILTMTNIVSETYLQFVKKQIWD